MLGYNGAMILLPRSARLRTRRREPELMDQPDLDPAEHERALRALARINCLSGIATALWPPLQQLGRALSPQPVRVFDVASGGGDVALALARRAADCGIALQIDGCDLSPVAVARASRHAQEFGANVRFFRHDALVGPLPETYDAVVCSLFLHHLDDSAAVGLLQRMAAAARHAVLVNDLLRTRRGYWLAWLGCRLLTRSPVVRVDGPRSVAAAFTIEEVGGLARRAGLCGAEISRHWPQRFLLQWRCP